MPGVFQDPMAPIVGSWVSKIRLAHEAKGKRFQRDADEGMKFFAGPYDFLYEGKNRRADRHFKQEFTDDDDNEIPAPRFQMTLNKTAELVQIFGPVLYHRNPTRQVNPREFPLPGPDLMAAIGQDPQTMMMLQQQLQQGNQLRAIDRVRAKLLEYYLNYTPNALDLKTESRWSIVETLVKGAGCLWTQMYVPPAGGQRMIGSFYDSCDNLLIDPDAKTLKDAGWIARKRIEKVWETERKFGLQPGTLKGQMESSSNQAEADATPEGAYLRATGQTCDLIVYYEIYSKVGLGGRLAGIAEWIGPESERYGDFCYLAVCNGMPCPLNINQQWYDLPDDQAFQLMYQAVQWAIPFWADGEWPVSLLGFHSIPGEPWPMSHMAPAMGELKFLNWAFSYIAGKIRISCRDIIAILEEASAEIKEAVLHGSDYEVVKIKGSAGRPIEQVVQFLKMPAFQIDIWKVIEAISEQFEKRVGLTELAYGMSSRQDRSATESATKRDQLSVRPDDMANQVEDWMSDVARKEAIALRFLLAGKDVTSIMGPTGAMLWDTYITPSDPAELLYSLEYRIESGSARKPNRDRDAANAQSLATMLLPFYENIAMQAAVVGPFNAVISMYCKANDIKVDGLLLPDPHAQPPGPAQPPAPGGPGQHQQPHPGTPAAGAPR